VRSLFLVPFPYLIARTPIRAVVDKFTRDIAALQLHNPKIRLHNTISRVLARTKTIQVCKM
jgi:hypothetical protein